MSETFFDRIAAPGSEFRGAPFWAWNGKLEPEELRRQIRIMKEMGLGGFFMHARVGLDTPYLGPEWFACVKACIDEAEKQGMRAWLYDEDRWPSGAAGGLVTSDPACRRRELHCLVGEEAIAEAPETLLAAFAVTFADDRTVAGYRRLETPGSELAAGEKRCRFLIRISEEDSWFNDQTYLDTLNEQAVAKFIEITHERYRREVGDAFARSVPGIFTDEPNFFHRSDYVREEGRLYALPWTGAIPAEFRARYGFDLLDRLPELFFAVRNTEFSRARYCFYDLLTSLFVNAFSRQIGAWCEKNRLLSTGHALAEDTQSGQTRLIGAAMRFYEHMQSPGIDLLTEHWNIFNTAKQCSSVAHQFGRQWRLSETYGCTGWDFPFAGHKALGDWQLALGINLRCQHLYYYTMAAEAKRDYPASIGEQSPWYRDYHFVEDYFARLNAALADGEEVRDLLVIQPIESTWGVVAAAAADREFTEREDRPLIELTNLLLSGHLDFDFGDEEMLSRHGRIADDGRIFLKLAGYRAVLLPEMRTVRASTLKLLTDFAAGGGQVFFLGEAPPRVDGTESEAAAELYRRFIPAERAGLAAALSPAVRRVSLADADGNEQPSLLYLLKKSAARRTLFVCNLGMKPDAAQMEAPLVRDRQLACPDVRIRVEAGIDDRVYELDPNSGELYRIETEARNGQVKFNASFAPLESHLYFITPERLPAAPARRPPGPVRSEAVLENAGWAIEYSEDNVLVLDHAAATVDGEELAGRRYCLALDDLLREKLGVRPRGGAMVQPYLQDKRRQPERQLALELQYAFRAETPPASDCRLALERPELYEIDLNGHAVGREARGSWVDPSLRCLALPQEYFRPGENRLTLRCRYHELLPGLESLFLLGDFGVVNDALTAPPRTLALGDWVRQGLPYYAGDVTYRTQLTLENAPDRPAELFIPDWRGVALKIRVNDGPATLLPWPPCRLDLAPFLRAGENRLAITVLGHRRNSHGPFFLDTAWPAWTGPAQFKDYRQEARQLVPCGLLAAPVLRFY